MLLTANGIDANDFLFPLAIAVVDAENYENWLWFERQLYKVLVQIKEVSSLKFLSERQKVPVNDLAQTLPDSSHGFCMCHLTQIYKRKFNHNLVVSLNWKAVVSSNNYEAAMRKIRIISFESEQWLRAIDPTFRSDAFFEDNRFI